MTYRGAPGDRHTLGIKPTKQDHTLVSAWSLMGIGVRQICVRLGEKYHLAKPMSRMTLYWHFRKDLAPNKRGPKVNPAKKRIGRPPTKSPILKAKVAAVIVTELQQMIEEARKRSRTKG